MSPSGGIFFISALQKRPQMRFLAPYVEWESLIFEIYGITSLAA